MPKYLIMGGAGFIGSHLSKALSDKGSDVVVVDRKEAVQGLHTKSYAIDIEDAKKLADVFNKEKPDVVFIANSNHFGYM